MLLYDDYSGEFWDPSREKRQPPILTRKEARRADREYREEIFIRVLMQPYTCWHSYFAGAYMSDPPIMSAEEWMKRQEQDMKEYRRIMEELQKDTG